MASFGGKDEYEDDFEKDEGWKEIEFSELEVGSKIGGGGFALVYSARWKGRDVAIKTLFDPKVDDKLKQDYMDELHVMRDLDHPNIVDFLGACMKPPKLCFVMELCGKSLNHVLHETDMKLSDELLISIATGVASALEYLHNRKPMIIHRDIKSHNLVLNADWTVKLCDFGLVSTRVTSAGTPHYMAPELMESKPFSNKVDVYAFGLLLWEMWVRCVPFSGWRATVIRDHVLAGKRLDLPKSYEAPPLIISLIRRCWAQSPADRPTISEVLKELKAWKPPVRALDSVGGGGDILDGLLK